MLIKLALNKDHFILKQSDMAEAKAEAEKTFGGDTDFSMEF